MTVVIRGGNTGGGPPPNQPVTSTTSSDTQITAAEITNPTELNTSSHVPLEENYSPTQASDAENQLQQQSSSPQQTQATEEARIASVSGDRTETRQRTSDSYEDHEPDFPIAELARLDDMINRPRWVIPVLPKGELEILLEASIDLCRRGLDTRSEPCQRFFREGLTISFTKILTDEAVSGWKFEIHRCIMQNCERLIELIVLKLSQDWFPLLDLLAMVLNPSNKFHVFTANRPETIPPSRSPEEEVFARSNDPRAPRGWLIELINKFGKLGGFKILLERFQSSVPLSVPLIAALIRPFGYCYELLTSPTVEKYFLPIIQMVPSFLENLTDDELKKESKNETKNDALSGLVKALKNLASRIPNQEETIKSLEIFRLKMILRLLQISSFNGKMNALNEVNKVIATVSYFSHRHGGGSGVVMEEEEWLTAERLAQWITENKVLQIVLRDSLHQPQYVEKLEKIIRFVIKEKALTLEDLDDLWAAQCGKHEAIVKNMHDLLAKLAWDFTPEQLDHLFDCFQGSWTNATKKQREKLLELIRRLAEDDKDGVMAHKVLNLLWNLAHNDDIPTDIMDQALAAHVKILDYSCCQDRDSQKTEWLDKCIAELQADSNWVLPALKQIREICCLYNEAPPNLAATTIPPPSSSGHQRSTHMLYRHEIINRLQSQHSLVVLVSENISIYMERARQTAKDNPNLNPNFIYPGSRFSHVQEVQERLNFLRFLLKDGQLWLCAPQAKQIWKCLAENEVYVEDREACFKWFTQLMTEEPDLDPDINKSFFESNILQLEPSLVTEAGIECFDRFFKAVNVKEGKLIPKRRTYYTEDLELIGLDYLWRVVLNCSDEVANSGIELLKEIYTNLGSRLQGNQLEIHDDFIQTCMDRLKASYDTVSVLEDDDTRIRSEVTKMTRVLKAFFEYIYQCDTDFGEERTIIPMGRSFRGRELTLTIRFPNQGRHIDDIEVHTHTNDPLSSVRRQILNRVKTNNVNTRVDLFLNNELIDPDIGRDKKLVFDLPVKDKMVLSGKLYQVSTNMPSSPDSSSDSSTGSPHHPYDGPSLEAENMLPGVIMSQHINYSRFFFQLADLCMKLNSVTLRDSALDILKIIPADKMTMDTLKMLCKTVAESDVDCANNFDLLFYTSSPTEAAYCLGVIYSLLMPARNPLSEEAQEFQYDFFKSGCGFKVLELLTRNNFLSKADDFTKICSYLMVLKISKLVLTTLAHYMILSTSNPSKELTILQQALTCIPNPSADSMVREVAQRTAQLIKNEERKPLKVSKYLPDMSSIKAVMMLSWVTATGTETALQAPTEKLHQLIVEAPECNGSVIHMACKDAMEVLTIMLMLSPNILEHLMKDDTWNVFVIDLVLISSNRSVRLTALDEFALIATKCPVDSDVLIKFIQLLHSTLRSTVPQGVNYKNSQDFFRLFCKLLNSACINRISLPQAQELLDYEIDILRNVRQHLIKDGLIEEIQLEGHLGITKELMSLLTSQQKFDVGCDGDTGFLNKNRKGIIQMLIDEYIFPASRAMVLQQKSVSTPAQQQQQKSTTQTGNQVHIEEINPICCSAPTLTAGFDVLVALCTGCIPNLKYVSDTLVEMFYSENDQPLTEWEYLPPVGPRPTRGFVGLKNAGATCYMNSVLQQLYMIPEIRDGILEVEGAAKDTSEDFSGEDKVESNMVTVESSHGLDGESGAREESRKEYNLGVLKYVQAIFGHLALSKLQYYVPRGFWKHFKLWGEPVNLREQHDALEFFNSLVDSLDEALKCLKYPALMSKVLGGSFADQKICRDCPHRYSREESFTALNIDIRNHSNLLDSLEQYVKGDLLEGANAYHCEKCNRKVDTVKRLCIKKLPTILAIQLKRFDYDWERECAIKFNDYFEFPRVLDMEPYTVRGLAKIEGEIIDDELVCEDEAFNESQNCTKYDLCGIVVHSGQASGGHYYSYILYKQLDGTKKWYKFDDGDVTECKLADDEEMSIQCFGGEYMGEVFDHMLKRMSCRRQKRWWNAYILFYRRVDTPESTLAMRLNELTLMESKLNSSQIVKMPLPILRSVQKQNIKFMHTKNQFSIEYFQFMKKMFQSNGQLVVSQTSQEVQENVSDVMKKEFEEIAMICTQLAARFLFNTCFHTKKTLRGSALDWYDVLTLHLRASPRVRVWFSENVLLAHLYRFCEYLLDCPSNDVRSAFGKIIVFLAHFALQDGNGQMSSQIAPSTVAESGTSLADSLIHYVLALLKKEVSEHSRHLSQYFNLFYQYASIGTAERAQLLKLNVASTFMLVALDEGPGPPIKYQYADLGRLYQVVSILVRCCDVSSKCASSHSKNPPLPNPYGIADDGTYILPIQAEVVEHLYNKTTYVKKIIEDANNTEETVKLLKFCSWENPHFSSMILNELLWQIAYSYCYELRPYLDLLYHMLLIEDTWQEHRIHNALKGMQDDREGLFDTIHRNKAHYQKRAYQCIKCLVTLFSNCKLAAQILQSNAELKRKWTSAVAWLNDELERRPYATNTQYGYNWSPPAQSNETSNGYYLERSHSAKITLAKAIELCPEDEREDQDDQEMSEDTDSPPPEAESSEQFLTCYRIGKSSMTTGGTTPAVVPSSTSTTAAPTGFGDTDVALTEDLAVLKNDLRQYPDADLTIAVDRVMYGPGDQPGDCKTDPKVSRDRNSISSSVSTSTSALSHTSSLVSTTSTTTITPVNPVIAPSDGVHTGTFPSTSSGRMRLSKNTMRGVGCFNTLPGVNPFTEEGVGSGVGRESSTTNSGTAGDLYRNRRRNREI